MIKPIQTDTKVVFGPCRLSYTHLFQKYSQDGKEGKYQTNILIPKTEEGTIKAIEAAIEKAKAAATASKWGGKEPRKIELPLKDGDDKDNDPDGVYSGHYYLNAKCSTRPGIVDRNGAPVLDEEEMYSGVWACVSVSFFGYDVNGNKGIACGLNNVMKYKDGERLGGRVSAERDFLGVNLDELDDEDL